MGQRVQTPSELLELKKEKFKINQFNLVVSDMVSVNRSLKDVRMEEQEASQRKEKPKRGKEQSASASLKRQSPSQGYPLIRAQDSQEPRAVQRKLSSQGSVNNV